MSAEGKFDVSSEIYTFRNVNYGTWRQIVGMEEET